MVKTLIKRVLAHPITNRLLDHFFGSRPNGKQEWTMIESDGTRHHSKKRRERIIGSKVWYRPND